MLWEKGLLRTGKWNVWSKEVTDSVLQPQGSRKGLGHIFDTGNFPKIGKRDVQNQSNGQNCSPCSCARSKVVSEVGGIDTCVLLTSRGQTT